MLVDENSRIKRIYNRLPSFLQHLALSYVGLKKERQRFGGNFKEYFKKLVERDDWSEDKLNEYRLKRLLDFTKHTASTVPYYQRSFKEIGIEAEDIRSFEDFTQLPILTKTEVQANLDDFFSTAFKNNRLIHMNTSGTTGTGLHFAFSLDGYREKWALWWRYLRRHGIDRQHWRGMFGANVVVPLDDKKPPFWRINYPGRSIYFSNYHNSDGNLPYYLEEISRMRLPWLNGFPSSIARLAHGAVATGWKPPSELRWVTIDSERLTPAQCEIIELAFGVRVLQHYGMAEAVANFSECPAGSLHIDEDFAHVEFLPHLAAGDSMRIIGTNLSNPAFPLLRYDTGDTAGLAVDGCDCGLPGRIVEEVEGRVDDYVITPSGAWIGRLGYIFCQAFHVREAQIIQKHIDQVQLLIAKRDGYTQEEEELILKSARNRLGPDMNIDIKYVDSIPRTKSGKIKFVVSQMGQIPC